MRVGLLFAMLVVGAGLAGCLGSDDDLDPPGAMPGGSPEDVVVVAVLDWQINPYHWDFLAAHMPHHRGDDPDNDLPLSEDPSSWLPGFPAASDFASYGSLDLSLDADDPYADPAALYEEDKDEWAKMEQTTDDGVHLRYIPGTKIVGLITSGDGDGFASSSHGGGASSVSVGNYHGSCPNCLLVFVDIPGSAGEKWVRQQDWIDVTTHSYEGSTVGGNVRDSIVDCDDIGRQQAVERGQQIFWAAGNGLVNTFTAPQTTLASCQKGPDWTVTVGAVHPTTQASYTGHAKPVHVASVGQGYPSAGGATVTAEGLFSGTSNATPVTAGLYAEALYRLRVAAKESERMQRGGVILEGGLSCGDANPDCAVADGNLTLHELRDALFQAAEHTGAYFHPSVQDEAIPVEGTQETMVWTQGHGVFMGRLGDWDEQVRRIVDHATGEVAPEETADVDAWMTAYSWCVQQVWGEWDHGAWASGETLPGDDPDWPLRSWMASDACPETVEALLAGHNMVRTVQGMVPPLPV